jgi:hypothetical protein
MYDDSYNYRLNKRKYFSDLIEGYGPYRFLLTLTFQRRILDDQGREYGEIFWRRLNKRIFEKNKRIPVTPIHGFAVLEKASITAKQDAERHVYGWENAHFHMLIKDHSVFSKTDDIAIKHIEEASWKVSKYLLTRNGQSLVSAGGKGVHVRNVYSDGICDYLAVDSTELGWKREERMFLLDGKGFVTIGERMPWQMF